jgi:hypothetical protein
MSMISCKSHSEGSKAYEDSSLREVSNCGDQRVLDADGPPAQSTNAIAERRSGDDVGHEVAKERKTIDGTSINNPAENLNRQANGAQSGIEADGAERVIHLPTQARFDVFPAESVQGWLGYSVGHNLSCGKREMREVRWSCCRE